MILAFHGDPMASEFASHIGMIVKYAFCICHACGLSENKDGEKGEPEIARLTESLKLQYFV